MGGSRFFVFLMAAQLVLFGIILSRLSALEVGITRLEAGAPSLHQPSGSMPDRVAAQNNSGLFSEARLRQIIRDEAEAVLVSLPAVQRGPSDTETEIASGDADEMVDFDHERELRAVQQSLDYYTQVGRITASEMAQLQSEIAKLRPSERTAMFGRLARALNEGTLEGRL